MRLELVIDGLRPGFACCSSPARCRRCGFSPVAPTSRCCSRHPKNRPTRRLPPPGCSAGHQPDAACGASCAASRSPRRIAFCPRGHSRPSDSGGTRRRQPGPGPERHPGAAQQPLVQRPLQRRERAGRAVPNRSRHPGPARRPRVPPRPAARRPHAAVRLLASGAKPRPPAQRKRRPRNQRRGLEYVPCTDIRMTRCRRRRSVSLFFAPSVDPARSIQASRRGAVGESLAAVASVSRAGRWPMLAVVSGRRLNL